MKAILVFATLIIFPASSEAAECRSVRGHLNGQAATAVRIVKLGKGNITLSGTFNGKPAPKRTMPCKTIAKGVFCETAFDGVVVTVQTNGKLMIEVITASTGQEMANMAYECNRMMKP